MSDKQLLEQLEEFEQAIDGEETQTSAPVDTDHEESPGADPDDAAAPAAEPEGDDGQTAGDDGNQEAAESEHDEAEAADQLVEVDGKQYTLSEIKETLEKAQTWKFQAVNYQKLLEDERAQRAAASESSADGSDSTQPKAPEEVRRRNQALIEKVKPHLKKAVELGQISEALAEDYPDDAALTLAMQMQTQAAAAEIQRRLVELEQAVGVSREQQAVAQLETAFEQAVDQLTNTFGEAYGALKQDEQVLAFAEWVAADPQRKEAYGPRITDPLILRGLYDQFILETGGPPARRSPGRRTADAALAGGAGGGGGHHRTKPPTKSEFEAFEEAYQQATSMR